MIIYDLQYKSLNGQSGKLSFLRYVYGPFCYLHKTLVLSVFLEKFLKILIYLQGSFYDCIFKSSSNIWLHENKN